MILYVVGQNINDYPEGVVWELQGVYDSYEKAKKACIKSNYFFGEIEMNKPVKDYSVEWPSAFYPNIEKVSNE
jgi:hypothetical protein